MNPWVWHSKGAFHLHGVAMKFVNDFIGQLKGSHVTWS